MQAKTDFSNHVWFHGGLDIIAFCVLLFALSATTPNKRMIQAVAVAALCPTIAIVYSLVATPYWNPLFIAAGIGCLAFAIWGFVLAGKMQGING